MGRGASGGQGAPCVRAKVRAGCLPWAAPAPSYTQVRFLKGNVEGWEELAPEPATDTSGVPVLDKFLEAMLVAVQASGRRGLLGQHAVLGTVSHERTPTHAYTHACRCCSMQSCTATWGPLTKQRVPLQCQQGGAGARRRGLLLLLQLGSRQQQLRVRRPAAAAARSCR